MAFISDDTPGMGTELDTTPHSNAAEQALLGALLYDNELYHRVSAIVEAKHFYNPVHVRIFETAARLIEVGKLADAIVLRLYHCHRWGRCGLGGPLHPRYCRRRGPVRGCRADV